MSLEALKKASIHVLVRSGIFLPSKLFIEEKCRQIVEDNREVFDRLA